VPSLDWHAAAGKGATMLGKERVNQELATPVSGNASKVSVDTAERSVYTRTRADTSSLCLWCLVCSQILIATTTGDPLRRIKQWYRYHAAIGVRVRMHCSCISLPLPPVN
jgi:hypothetical protein